MSEQRTIRACKSAIASLLKWITTAPKALWFKDSICAKDKVSDEVVDEPQDNYTHVGNMQCRIETGLGLQNEQVFTVKLLGKIQTDKAGRLVSLKLNIDELNETNNQYVSVYRRNENNSDAQLLPFEYICELGKINHKEKEFADWISAAKIKPEWMLFSRKGSRRIRITVLLFNLENSDVYAQCETFFEFYNRDLGYIDIAENAERAKALAVTLAFALSAADGRMYKTEIEKIKEWTLKTFQIDRDNKAQKELVKALRKTIRFFKRGQNVNIEDLCKELSGITEVWQRYDILSLCLNVAETKGFISAGQIKVLKNLSKWFNIEPECFRAMLERLAPVDTHEVQDPELIFGLHSRLSREQKRELLNNEYKKWNARVTNLNPQVQSQAEQMLELITNTRSKCLN
ncbi:MAG: hypothetical protein JW804_09270 [Sedimentisphaerales bacterium]|nr:hypothetical protein [Sedimentisphaerales bacterium]